MRRATLIAGMLAAAVGVSACGSSSGHAAAGPLASSLSYFPADTPIIATVPTASTAGSTAQLTKVPSATLLKAALFQELAKLGIDYDSDLKPLFGNPAAIGIGSASVGAGETKALLAWRTKSASALKRLIGDVHGLTRSGSDDGATIYTAPRLAIAIDGAQAVVSQDTATLDAALDRHAHGSGFTSADYSHDLSGLPTGDGVAVVGDLATALSSPRAAQARAVPWVSALGDFGMVVGGTSHQTGLHFRIDTTGRSLTSAQLPLAAGASSPQVAATSLPDAVALRDPAAVWHFITGALQTASPAQYAKLVAKESKARRYGVDVDALLSSLTGDLQVSSSGHLTYGREKVSSATAAMLMRLLAHPADGGSATSLGDGLYRIDESSGTTLVAGAVNGTFVMTNASAALARRFAAVGSQTVPGARGAFVSRDDLGALLALDSRLSSNPLLPQLTSTLGDLTLSVQSATQALTGTLSLGRN